MKFRSRKGSAIIEAGPSLYILLIVIFFPLMDLLFMGMQFCCAWYLNHEAAHEVSISKYPDWSTALTQVKTKFNATGIPTFAKIKSGTQVATPIPAPADKSMPAQVKMDTSVVMAPWLNIPLPIAVTGLNADMTINMSSLRVFETAQPTDGTGAVSAAF